jgi:hypothetical protein
MTTVVHPKGDDVNRFDGGQECTDCCGLLGERKGPEYIPMEQPGPLLVDRLAQLDTPHVVFKPDDLHRVFF